LAYAQRSIDEMPRFISGHQTKVVALGNLGRRQEAKAAADTLLIYDPLFTVSARTVTFRNPRLPAKILWWNAGCWVAGVSTPPMVD
jgi:hypothetical protein